MDLHVSLVGRRDVTGQIYGQLRQAIVSGVLRPGDRLPPTRELATRLAVSRTTVTVAYDRLAGEGFLSSRVGAGTFVSDDVPIAGPEPGPPAGVLRPLPIWERVAMPRQRGRRPRYDFRLGRPDPTLFPFEQWRSLVTRQLTPAAAASSGYGEPAGHEGLRAAIAHHIGTSRAVRATAADVVITNGIQQAIDLIARTLLSPGDSVAVEDPGYPPSRGQLTAHGAQLVGIAVDDEGIVVDAIPPTVRLVIVTPSHQFPLGVAMSLRRRVALLRWAEEHDAAIIEDDYDSEFRFGGRPIEPLQSLDATGRVVYTGSFSKTMLPSMRLGFLVTPPSLRRALVAAKYVTDWATSTAEQAAMAEFIDRGWFARHLRRMRSTYRRRHEIVSAILAEDFADLVKVVPSAAGLHISAHVPGRAAEEVTAIVRRARADGVDLYALGSFGVRHPRPAGIVLGYGAISADDIPEGLRVLRACFD